MVCFIDVLLFFVSCFLGVSMGRYMVVFLPNTEFKKESN